MTTENKTTLNTDPAIAVEPVLAPEEGRCLDYPCFFCHPDNFIECENCENNFRLFRKRQRTWLLEWLRNL
jgi:hypothetical protein